MSFWPFSGMSPMVAKGLQGSRAYFTITHAVLTEQLNEKNRSWDTLIGILVTMGTSI